MLPAVDTPRCELGVVGGGLGANSLLAEQLRAKKPRQIHVIDDGFGLGSDGEHSVLRARRPLHTRAVPRPSLHPKSTRAKQSSFTRGSRRRMRMRRSVPVESDASSSPWFGLGIG